MSNMNQMNLLSHQQQNFYGGVLVKGSRKITRPLSSKKPTHLTLKCIKNVDLYKDEKLVLSFVKRYSDKFGIKVYRSSVQRDHIHLAILIHNREEYKKFVRSLTGMLARKYGKGMWKTLPFTRVCSWGRDFKNLKHYIDKNEREVRGIQAYQPRTDHYARFR